MTISLYTKSPQEARNDLEIEAFRASHKVNEEARKELDNLITKNNDGMHLATDKVLESFLQKYDTNRLALILAAHISDRTWDGRFHKDVIHWAIDLMGEYSEDFRKFAQERYYLNSHSVLIDAIAHDFIYYIQ